jgi:hypothetical protein
LDDVNSRLLDVRQKRGRERTISTITIGRDLAGLGSVGDEDAISVSDPRQSPA